MKPIQNYLMNTRFEDGWNYWNKYPANDSQVRIASGTGYIGNKFVMITRSSISFTVPSDCKKVRIRSVLSHGTGTCYMTCFQLEEGAAANKFNLMETGSFGYWKIR